MFTTEKIAAQRKRNWAWIWLGYTGFLFIQPILDPSREVDPRYLNYIVTTTAGRAATAGSVTLKHR